MKLLAAAAILGGIGLVMTLAEADVSDRTVKTDAFDKVYFSGAATINLAQGGETAVRLSGLERVLDDVEVEVVDGVLYVDVDDDVEMEDLTIDLTVVDLAEFVSSGHVKFVSDELRIDDLILEDRGTGDYRFVDLKADELSVDARGASRFELTGEVRRQVVDIAGASRFVGNELKSETTEVYLKGAASVDVWAEEVLDVRIAGAGRVRYTGSPYVRQRILGAGSVKKIDE